MSTRMNRGLPARLEGVRRRFETWRGNREGRSPIPEELWDAAVKMAGMYGLHRTAKALRLNYYQLKKRGERTTATADTPQRDPATTFLELTPPISMPAAFGSGECTMELEGAGGAKMRVHLKGMALPDLAALSRSFWQGEP